MSEPFDVLAYLQEELPGFTFREEKSTFAGITVINARTTLTLGVGGELGMALLPVPQKAQYQKEWADQLIKTARAHASQETGLDKVWDAREKHLKEMFAAERIRLQQEAENRIQQEIGKAYLAGKAAGRAEEMAYANGDEDDE